MTGTDGRLRICDLSPGMYRVEIHSQYSTGEAPVSFGITYVTVKDEDQRGLKFLTSSGATLDAEIVWDTPPPESAPPLTLRLNLRPTLRTGFPGAADWNGQKTEVPGNVSFQNLFFDEYEVQTDLRKPGLYIKDVTYAGQSIWRQPFRYGSAMQGAGLRVVVARDGGTITAQVSDKDGNPIGDVHVVFFPADTSSEGALAATMVKGKTDQLGRCPSKTLAPGTYYVLASDEEFTASTDSIAKLWHSRTSLQKVELAPGGSPQVKLQLTRLM